jgi:hypothetical protein
MFANATTSSHRKFTGTAIGSLLYDAIFYPIYGVIWGGKGLGMGKSLVLGADGAAAIRLWAEEESRCSAKP